MPAKKTELQDAFRFVESVSKEYKAGDHVLTIVAKQLTVGQMMKYGDALMTIQKASLELQEGKSDPAVVIGAFKPMMKDVITVTDENGDPVKVDDLPLPAFIAVQEAFAEANFTSGEDTSGGSTT